MRAPFRSIKIGVSAFALFFIDFSPLGGPLGGPFFLTHFRLRFGPENVSKRGPHLAKKLPNHGQNMPKICSKNKPFSGPAPSRVPGASGTSKSASGTSKSNPKRPRATSKTHLSSPKRHDNRPKAASGDVY